MLNFIRSIFLVAICCFCAHASATSVFINEFHYDNAGGDINEGVEIAALAGTNLKGYQLFLYNGSTGGIYQEILLSGVISDQSAGFGTLYFALSGIQNGPDALALTDADGTVLQFISYEGSFTATSGAADGMTSLDIGVFEAPDNDMDQSLQLTGSGSSGDMFSWVLADSSPGEINVGQSFAAPVPLPAAFWFMGTAMLGLFGLRKPGVIRRRVNMCFCDS